MTLHDPFYDERDPARDEAAPERGSAAQARGEFGAASIRPALDARVPLVPRGGLFEGQVAIVAETAIEGSVRGSLRGPGTLVIGEDARVEGLVECEAVVSRGGIVGPVVARRRVQLAGSARLEGDVEAPAVQIEDDARWTGRARIGGPDRR